VSSAAAGTAQLADQLLDTLGPKSSIVGSSAPVPRSLTAGMVRDLDPRNPNWNPSHPKWPEVSKLVEEDIAGDLRGEVASRQERYRAGLADELSRRLSADELGRLLAYLRGTDGQRYLAFQSELGLALAMAMHAAFSGMPSPAAAPADAGAPAPEDVMKERARLVGQSTLAQVTQCWLDEAKDSHQDVSGFQAWPMMVVMFANYQGARLDDLRERYAADLKEIETFNASALGHRYHTAFATATKALAEETLTENESFLGTETQKFGARWKARYAEATSAQ
jgi:hypothetical protein